MSLPGDFPGFARRQIQLIQFFVMKSCTTHGQRIPSRIRACQHTIQSVITARVVNLPFQGRACTLASIPILTNSFINSFIV
jgi:hypothetical protein